MQEPIRARLILGKYRVVSRTALGFRIALGGTTEMDCIVGPAMSNYDIRDGDILTVYTEVLAKPPGA